MGVVDVMFWMNRGYDVSPSIRVFLPLPSCKHLPIFGIQQNIVLPNNELETGQRNTHNRIGTDGIDCGLNCVTKMSKFHPAMASYPLLVVAPKPLNWGQFAVEFGIEDCDVATILNCLG